MPLLIGFLILMGTAYQLFFRYERWPNPERQGMLYEHDNLTGETRQLEPGTGTRASVFARILGPGKEKPLGGSNMSWERLGAESERPSNSLFERLDPEEMGSDHALKEEKESAQKRSRNQESSLSQSKIIAKMARPIPTPKDVVVASNAPPVPMAMLAIDHEEAHEAGKPFAIRQIDLNQDGDVEEIIQKASEPDGLLDISIVKGGQEIFFGRGAQISLLPTRSNEGWSDIVLKTGKSTLKVFRYNAAEHTYKVWKG
ncbi:MAG TPA: hypothetical protein V6C52_11040 [Coleofasciculaceae cyanobacterium]|jgi:hypothetical protein